MRAFLAVDVSADARASIAVFQRASAPRSLRWVRPENLHLTLRFLGDVEPAEVAALGRTVRRGVRDCPPFVYRLRGGGCFPNAKRARVVWVGVEPVPAALAHLHRSVEDAVSGRGFAAEDRDFHPHLTIARLKSPDPAVNVLVDELNRRDFGETAVRELVLFESRLSPRGASYHVVERFELAGPSVPVPKQLV